MTRGGDPVGRGRCMRVARAGAPNLLAAILLAAAILPAAACRRAASQAAALRPAAVDEARAVAADAEPGNWLLHGRTYDEQRFSPLEEVRADNVSKLGLAWHHDFETLRGMEATPIVVDGVLYVSGAWSRVYAFDAKSGRKLWSYDPEVPGSWAVHACCDVVNRGVAAWDGQVFVGTIDGRLVALDAATGAVRWEQLTIDRSKPYTITGAPRVVKGKVLIGNGGAEFGVRGYVSAYDAKTGALAWRFYTVPGDPAQPFEQPILKKAAETWRGKWWELGGGGTVWDSMAYDPALDLLYIGVGNGSPWNPELRSPGGGDNWFLASIVALRPDTGEYVWHYQTTPREAWDYTATQHMILADLEVEGRRRAVILQAPKNGFFYVLDRGTGEFLSAKPFVPVTWASGIDASGRPIENPNARYERTGKLEPVMPGFLGGHNWHPMSFSRRTGLVYIPAQELDFPYKAMPKERFKTSALSANLGVDVDAAGVPPPEAVAAARGRLLAWDPIGQREVWRVEHKGPWSGGVLSTAGNLVFQGNAAGAFSAYAADKGTQLWSFDAQTGVMAPPISYAVDGEQYVAVLVGWGSTFSLLGGEVTHKSGPPVNRSRLLAFKLGATGALPPLAEEKPAEATAAPAVRATAQQLARGTTVFNRYCAPCHGVGAVAGGVLPDLRFAKSLADAEVWRHIVLDGALAGRGMVGFAAELSPADAEAARAYVAGLAALAAGKASKPTAAAKDAVRRTP